MSARETGKSTARDGRLGRPNLPFRAGSCTAGRHLDLLLAESRRLVRALEAEPLGRLQTSLEAERGNVRV